MGTQLRVGEWVEALENSLDERRAFKGSIGVVQGFARFSSYHPREVSVVFEDGRAAWFWERSVCRTAQPLTRTERFAGPYADSFAA